LTAYDALEAQGVVPVGVLADKGYASAANRDRCITAPANAPTTAIPAHFRMRKESVDFSVF
jgi:hypothetical protein